MPSSDYREKTLADSRHAFQRHVELAKSISAAWSRSDEERNAAHVEVMAAATDKRQELEASLRWALEWLHKCHEEPLPDEEIEDYERWRAACTLAGKVGTDG